MGWSQFRKTGLTYVQSGKAFKGYTLVCPFGVGAAFLLDMQGRIVHRWTLEDDDIQPGYGRLLENGNLLLTASTTPPDKPPKPLTPEELRVAPIEERSKRFGGHWDSLCEIDWSGKSVWRHDDPCGHHDFARLPNGNTLYPVNIDLPEDVERQVRGGRSDRKKPRLKMCADDFVEVDSKGKEVRRIHHWQLMDPRKDAICPLEGRGEWTHTNSIAVNDDGDILFSCRHNSIIGIISHETEEITWKFGAPDLSHQHHASFLRNGNVQVFDNGGHGRFGGSRVIELDPKTSKEVWSLRGDPADQFYSSFISGADRLPNNNVLVCEGSSGRVFEVTRGHEVVWEWISPFTAKQGGGAATRLFRAHRYSPDHPALAGKELDPDRYADLNRLYGLTN